MEEQITKRIKKTIKEQVFPGCVVGVVKKNGEKIILPFGTFTYGQDSIKIQANSIFDVASITKSIPTSSLALKLIKEGKIKLEDKVIDFIPELNTSCKDQILIKHLLTYTLDFDLRLSDHKDKSPNEILTLIYNAKLKTPPGSAYCYANVTAILLGILIERVSNEKLDNLASSSFFYHLNMTRTTFHPEKFDKNEIVPTEIDDWRGRVIQGEIHDESAYALFKKQIVGSAGLFSTAVDLLKFLEMLLNNPPPQGLGWEFYQPRYMGHYCSQNTFGKTGFTGCVIICDIEKSIGLTILSNYTYPKRKPNAQLINEVRKNIADIVFKHV